MWNETGVDPPDGGGAFSSLFVYPTNTNCSCIFPLRPSNAHPSATTNASTTTAMSHFLLRPVMRDVAPQRRAVNLLRGANSTLRFTFYVLLPTHLHTGH